MSAIRIMPQDEADAGFGLLKDVIEMVKNPKAIDEAYAQRRKAVQLNEDEIKKAEDARALIAKADALNKKFADMETALAEKIKKHKEEVEFFDARSAADTKRLTDWEAALGAKEDKQKEIEDGHNAMRKRLDEREQEIEAAHAQWLADQADTAKENADNKKTNEDEKVRLAALAEKLKAKAEKLAALATADE